MKFVDKYFINTDATFGIAFEEMKPLAITGKVIVFVSVYHDCDPVSRDTEVFVPYVVIVLVIDRVL